ncbi:MAG: cyclic nucleotide-binding domain-containing protein [Gammaproteobacteria bacterium]|nr:cyclic nucleotide-binding domain-containing protein [Gammaproteobacteria bacterium]
MSQADLVKTADKSISNHEIFGNLLKQEEKQFLMDRGIVCSYGTGQVICQQNERKSSLYIVLLGEVEVNEGDGHNKVVLAHLDKGEVFGEISALFGIPRVSNVVASKPTVVLEITGTIFEEVIKKNPTLLKAIVQRFGDRIVETALRTIPFLRYLPVDSLQKLISESSLVSVIPDNLIVKEGEQGDAMFIIIHGAAKLTHNIKGESIPLAIAGPGDYFGEWSVLTGAPRTATVKALSHIEMIRIERNTILEFIQDNPGVRDRIDQIAHMRHDGIIKEYPEKGSDKQTRKVIEEINSILDND